MMFRRDVNRCLLGSGVGPAGGLVPLTQVTPRLHATAAVDIAGDHNVAFEDLRHLVAP